MARIPLHPKNPDRICWGCDAYCPDTDLACGNGTIRTPHPVELFGEDWYEWVADRARTAKATDASSSARAIDESDQPSPWTATRLSDR